MFITVLESIYNIILTTCKSLYNSLDKNLTIFIVIKMKQKYLAMSYVYLKWASVCICAVLFQMYVLIGQNYIFSYLLPWFKAK